jgi:Protein of unknown function (DUF998)
VTRSEPSTRPDTLRVAARFAFSSTAAFLALLIALHLLKPQFNSSGHMISEYELGLYGWMMRLAFACLGSGSLALSLTLSPAVRTRGGHIGRWWLFLIGIAFICADAFIPDSIGRSAASPQAYLHGICGVVVIFSSPIAITLLDRSLVNKSPRVAQHPAWPTMLVWVGFLSFYVSAAAFTTARKHETTWDFGMLASASNRWREPGQGCEELVITRTRRDPPIPCESGALASARSAGMG